MWVVWLAAKVLLWVLAALLALVVFALFVPVTAELEYAGGRFWVWVRVLAVRVRVYPPKEKQPAKASKRERRAHNEESPSAPGVDSPPPQAGAGGGPSAQAAKPRRKLELGRLLEIASTAGGAARRILAGLRVRHIRVYWPVQGRDAADTAILYGRVCGGISGALGVLNNLLRLEFDELRPEADFTGEHQGQEHFSCKITGQLFIMVSAALYALWRLKRQDVV